MFTRWNDNLLGLGGIDEAFSMFDALRRQLDRATDTLSRTSPQGSWESTQWPRTTLSDTGNALELAADVPGLTDKDIELTLNNDVLSLKGERTASPPEGYSVHRQERPSVKFSRSMTLPCRVDAERTTASVKDGVLTVILEKAKEAQPRQITVSAR